MSIQSTTTFPSTFKFNYTSKSNYTKQKENPSKKKNLTFRGIRINHHIHVQHNNPNNVHLNLHTSSENPRNNPTIPHPTRHIN